MNSVLFLSLFSIIFVGFVGYASAYDGEIKVQVEAANIIEGDKIFVEVFLIGVEPNDDSSLVIDVIGKGTGSSVEKIILNPNWVYDDITFFGDHAWKTNYEFETINGNLTANTTYYIKAAFDDETDITGIFAFVPPVKEQIISDSELVNSGQSPREIPQWIKGIFSLYSSGQIDDDTLLNAIEYLIQIGTIQVTK